MIAIFVTILAFLILIQIPVIKEITYTILALSIVAFLITFAFLYADNAEKFNSQKGITR